MTEPYKFDEPLETLYQQCTPFSEGPLWNSDAHKEANRNIETLRRLLAAHDPTILNEVEAALDAYLDVVDLEVRHYFAEGYRLGRESLN